MSSPTALSFLSQPPAEWTSQQLAYLQVEESDQFDFLRNILLDCTDGLQPVFEPDY
jgi:hypothetical protein